MIRVLNYFNTFSRPSLIIINVLIVILMGTFDYLTGNEINFTIFYLIPVAAAAWYLGKNWGIAISFSAMLVWFFVDYAAHAYGVPVLSDFHVLGIKAIDPQPYARAWVPYWNASVQLAFSVIITSMLADLHSTRRQEKQLTQFIVHDLRSPLTNVLTGLQTLQTINTTKPQELEQEITDMAISASQRMLTMINSLLDLSQLEHHQMPLQYSEVQLQELANTALDSIALWANQQEVKLIVNIETPTTTVQIDREMTQRVLGNILSNSMKFSPPGSTVSLSIKDYEPGVLSYSISDQGPGIPREWVHKVFDKFAQVNARKQGAVIGSGLGLAFCRLAVEAQQGRIWVENPDEQPGTTITFSLPKTPPT